VLPKATAAASPREAAGAALPDVAGGETTVVALSARLTRGAASERERARALYCFVRDQIEFGFTWRFDRATPEQTLQLGVGHGNPQARLVVALFRAAGIAAAQHFVTIPRDLLHGLFTGAVRPPELITHSYVEAVVEGRRVRFDGYVLDPLAYRGAIAQLNSENRAVGYGAHLRGRSEWDGASDCMLQLASAGSVKSTHDHGTFDDPEEFYASATYRHRPGSVGALVFGAFGAASANVRIAALRKIGEGVEVREF
jgi:transglutaminase-like putative cysteine protease